MSDSHLNETIFQINGQQRKAAIEHRALLIDVLREDFGLTGTKRSCDVQVCGACTVLVDGKPVSSCSTLAIDCENKAIQTIESANDDDLIQAIQAAFIKHGALQCGFCTPGMIMAVKAMIATHDSLSEDTVKHYLHGNICRCTGYRKIIVAVLDVASSIGHKY